MLLFKQNPDKDKLEHNAKIAALAEMSSRIHEAKDRFNDVGDRDLIDACIFEIKSLESKYKFLLQEIKSMELKH